MTRTVTGSQRLSAVESAPLARGVEIGTATAMVLAAEGLVNERRSVPVMENKMEVHNIRIPKTEDWCIIITSFIDTGTFIETFETSRTLAEILLDVQEMEKSSPQGYLYEEDFGKLIMNNAPIYRWCVFDKVGGVIKKETLELK